MTSFDSPISAGSDSANARDIPPRKPPQVKSVTVFIFVCSLCFNKEKGSITDINLDSKTIKIATKPNTKYLPLNANK